jgi:multidrug efflux pump subunit AcrA (membrane-fusion protein)
MSARDILLGAVTLEGVMSRALAFVALAMLSLRAQAAPPSGVRLNALPTSQLHASPPPVRLQGYVVFKAGDPAATPAPVAAVAPVQARLVPVQRHDFARWLTLPVTIAARERSELSAPLSGVIEKVLVEPGQSVKSGQPLASLLVRDSAGRQALIKLVAPFDGEVSAADAHVGTFVQEAGPPLFTLLALDQVQLSFGVPERAIPTVHAGTPLQLTVEVYPNRVYDARVQRVQPEIDPATHTFRAFALLDNPEHGLWPEMSGHVALAVQHHAQVLALPQAAVSTQDGGAAVVFRLGTDGRAQRAPVTLGVGDGAWVEIAAGLAEGDRVLVGEVPLRDGGAVSVAH